MEDSQLAYRRKNQYLFLDHPKLHRVVDKTIDECIDYFLRFKLSFGKKVLNVKKTENQKQLKQQPQTEGMNLRWKNQGCKRRKQKNNKNKIV